MSAINPTSGIGSPQWPSLTAPAGKDAQAAKGGFGKTLSNCVESVEKDQQASTQAIQDLLTGRTQDVLPVVTAVAKADLSFKLLMGVRNKVIEAYKQTMNMQV